MTLSYTYIHRIALIASLYSMCLSMSMEQTAIIHLPKEMLTHIYSSIDDIKAQDRLRITCKDWKKTADKLTAHSGLLRLLHNLPDANKETKTRILCYAIYTNDYHLTKRILESTPERLYTVIGDGRYVLDPYHIAQHKNNENILKTLKKYHYNKTIKCSKWPQDPIEEKLLITALSEDNIGFENVLHTNFNQKNVFPSLGKKNPTLSKYTHLKESFYIITENDDELCIEPCIQWIKNNPKFTFLITLLLKEALKKKCAKVFTKIVKSYENINTIEICNINGITKEQTLKDKLLWNRDWNEEKYYQEIEIILDSFGAKTVQELKNNQSGENNAYIL